MAATSRLSLRNPRSPRSPEGRTRSFGEVRVSSRMLRMRHRAAAAHSEQLLADKQGNEIIIRLNGHRPTSSDLKLSKKVDDTKGGSHKKGRRVQDAGRGDACGLALSA